MRRPRAIAAHQCCFLCCERAGNQIHLLTHIFGTPPLIVADAELAQCVWYLYMWSERNIRWVTDIFIFLVRDTSSIYTYIYFPNVFVVWTIVCASSTIYVTVRAGCIFVRRQVAMMCVTHIYTYYDDAITSKTGNVFRACVCHMSFGSHLKRVTNATTYTLKLNSEQRGGYVT